MKDSTFEAQIAAALEELYAGIAAVSAIFDISTGNAPKFESGARHADAVALGAVRVLDGAARKIEGALAAL